VGQRAVEEPRRSPVCEGERILEIAAGIRVGQRKVVVERNDAGEERSRQQALQRPVPNKSDLPRCARRCHHDPWLALSPCAPERVYSRWAMHATVPYIVRVGAFSRASRRCILTWTGE